MYNTNLLKDWYIYLMERLMVEDRANQRQIEFKLFPKQKELCDLLEREKYVIINKSRVVGATTTVCGLIAAKLFMATPERPETVAIVCNTFEQSSTILKKIERFLIQYRNMFFLDVSDLNNGDGLFAKTGKRHLVLNNGSQVLAKSSDPSCVCGVGGVTWIVFDESAWISRGDDVYASVLPTLVTGGRVTMISTPNGKDRLHYETCRRAALKGTKDWNGYELFEMKWYEDPRFNKNLKWFRIKDGVGEIIVEKCPDNEGNVEYDPIGWKNLIDMGYRPLSPWYASMCDAYGNDKEKIARELDASFEPLNVYCYEPKET